MRQIRPAITLKTFINGNIDAFSLGTGFNLHSSKGAPSEAYQGSRSYIRTLNIKNRFPDLQQGKLGAIRGLIYIARTVRVDICIQKYHIKTV
jgi:hypothetical protein